MKKIIYITFALILFSSFSITAQELYVGQVYSNIERNIVTYGDDLKLDFYTAKEAKENKERPLLLVVHGGGFTGGTRDGDEEIKFSQTMATKGYAVASIDYRLTRKDKPTGFGCDCPAQEKIATFKAAVEDILQAVSFLKTGEEYLFDPTKIILVGSSAGAEAVLQTVYMSAHPDFRSLNLKAKEFAAVVSFAGAVVDVRYIQEGNATPAFMVHGTADNLVPYATAVHHYCKLDDAGFLPLDGSKTIAQQLKELNASFYLMTAPEGDHGWAGKGYNYTDELAGFINTVVIKGEIVQQEVNIAE